MAKSCRPSKELYTKTVNLRRDYVVVQTCVIIVILSVNCAEMATELVKNCRASGTQVHLWYHL